MNHQIKKILVAGIVGAGKTTLVKTISDIEAVKTETDKNQSIKAATTCIDFGRFKIDKNLVLHLYGIPNQLKLKFTWDILITKADACLLLIPAHQPDDLPEANKILNFINNKVQIPLIFGITHTDCFGALGINQIANKISSQNIMKRNIFKQVDPRQSKSIKNILKDLIEKIKFKEKVKQSIRDNSQDFSSSLKIRQKK